MTTPRRDHINRYAIRRFNRIIARAERERRHLTHQERRHVARWVRIARETA